MLCESFSAILFSCVSALLSDLCLCTGWTEAVASFSVHQAGDSLWCLHVAVAPSLMGWSSGGHPGTDPGTDHITNLEMYSTSSIGTLTIGWTKT